MPPQFAPPSPPGNPTVTPGAAPSALCRHGVNGPALYTPPICDQVGARCRVFGVGIGGSYKIRGGMRHSCECRRLHRDRLRWKRPLAQDVALGHRTLFDSENRPASLTIQDVEVARLRCESKRRNPASVLHDVEQSGRRWWIVIPQIVMDRLEVPFILSSLNIDRHDRVSEGFAPFRSPPKAPGIGDARGRYTRPRDSSKVK